MTRLRYNGLIAEVAGSGLTSSATSITFAAALTHSGGTNVPTITGSNYIPLTILDADGVPSEIVHLTAYTAAATTGTITRSQEGTTGVSHGAGDRIAHGANVFDVETVACKVTRSAAYNLAVGTLTPIPWDAETYDTHGFHDNSTNNTRLTVPPGYGGLYTLGGVWVPAQALASGRVLCRIMVNGTEIWGTEVSASGVFASPAAVTDHVLAAGDYAEFAYFQENSSKTLQTTASGFFLRRVGEL